MKSEKDWIEKLKAEGFYDIAVCPNKPNTDFGEHDHDRITVHVILNGELIMKDKNGEVIKRKGERFEIPAGTIHSAKSGPEGCTFITGFKD